MALILRRFPILILYVRPECSKFFRSHFPKHLREFTTKRHFELKFLLWEKVEIALGKRIQIVPRPSPELFIWMQLQYAALKEKFKRMKSK